MVYNRHFSHLNSLLANLREGRRKDRRRREEGKEGRRERGRAFPSLQCLTHTGKNLSQNYTQIFKQTNPLPVFGMSKKACKLKSALIIFRVWTSWNRCQWEEYHTTVGHYSNDDSNNWKLEGTIQSLLKSLKTFLKTVIGFGSVLERASREKGVVSEWNQNKGV